MKRAILASVAMSATLALFGAEHTPTYFKLVVTEGGDNSTVCQISQLAFFDAGHHYVSTNLEEKTTVSAASGLDENSFFSATVFTNIENQTHTYADGPIGVIFVDNDKKWCFKNDAHGGIGNYDNGNDGTVTLVMRLADDAQPVAYNFCSGNDDYKYKNRAFTSWKLYGSVNGSDWELCDEVSNLAPTNQNFAWYAGTITGTANAGCFPVGKVYDEARGALSVAQGVVPGGIPQIELTSYGLGATNASVVLEWSAVGDFTDTIQSEMTIDGAAQLGTPVALTLPDGLEPGETYSVRAQVTNSKSVSTTLNTMSYAVPPLPATQGYLKRATFTVGYQTTDPMEDFRVLVRLSENSPTGFTYNDCSSDGSDLLVTSVDGKTAYYFDVDTWKPDGESCIWVRLPRAKSGDQFNLFYGKTGSASQASSANTWSDYTGVWHMSEQIAADDAAETKSKNATGDTTHDAVPKHGSSVGDDRLAQMVSTNGVVGLARVNGTENGGRRCYLSVPSYTGVGDTFTISGWFKANGVNSYPRLISRKESYNSDNGFEWELSNGSKTQAGVRGASDKGCSVTFDDITKNWVHMTFVFKGTNVTGYVNGANPVSGAIAAVSDTDKPLSFGNNSNGSEGSFNGMYDEIRLRKGALSATRVAAEYATMTDAGFLVCDGVASTSPDMPVLSAASVEWLNDATTVSLTLDAGVGEASVVFTNVLTGADYTVTLAAELDARSGAVSPTYTLTAEQLPRDATYTWFVRVSNSNFERPAQIAGNAKYYSGAANPTVRYVAKTGSDDNDGMLLSTAKATLTAAIADLGEDGGTVYIDDGDYAFTSDTDTAVTITTPVKVIGLSRDATKVTITRTGKPERVFILNNASASLGFVTVYGGKSAYGMSVEIESGSMEDCVIRDSQRENWDCYGAVYLKSGRIARCLFTGNIGGGSHATGVKADGGVVENSLFTENNHTDAWTGNGGIVMVNNSARLVNCTIAGNTGGICSGVKVEGNAKAINCAIFGNTTKTDTTGHGHIWYGKNSLDSFVNCAADGEINDACFVVQPGFRDAALHDYTLTPAASGLIDQGLAYGDAGATSTTDFAGGTRQVGNVDIGCYEYAKSGFDVGFAASAHEGLLPGPVAVTFTATVFGATEPASYAWDFDNDGTTDEITTTPTVTHTYVTAGVKSIRLTATSGSATASVVMRDAIKVSPAVVYANSANAANAHFPYDTPETATPDLAEAIEIAGNGSTILVADGTYTAEGTYGFSIDKALRVMSVSGNPAGCILSSQGSGTHRTVTVNNPDAIVAGFTIRDGYISSQVAGASLLFRDLGGMVSNCVVSLGRSGGWNGDGALAAVAERGRLTHSILEQGLCNGDQQKDQKTACVTIWGLVDNCLIRDFNRANDNQNIVMVHSGGKLLNCTIVNGLCNTTTKDGGTTDCVAVRAETGARVENCAIAGVRHDNGDDTFSVRAWNGDANCFTNCATDTESPINESCIKVTTAAFKNFANADYRAAGASSPLVNAGVNNELAEGTDFTCRFRKIGPRMDIGCYEHQANAMVITVR